MSTPYWKEKLKPCPFCGAEAYIDGFMDHQYIRCYHKKNCIVNPNTWLKSDLSIRKQINAWNRRKGGDEDS